MADSPAFKFAAALPKFVKEAFAYKEYWDFGPDMWSHAVVVEKRVNLEGWNLLHSWVDLRGSNLEGSRWDKVDTAKKRNEYGYEPYTCDVIMCTEYRHQFGFGVIKHRVVRNPSYYINYIIIPLELMVTSAFSIFFLSFEEDEDGYQIPLADRLSILVSLFLAVTAFQLQISESMPYSDQYTLIDQYFLLAYFVLAGLSLESSMANVIDIDRIHDAVCGALFFSLWQIHSFQFAFKYFNFGGYGSGSRFWSWKTLLRAGGCGLYGCFDAVKMCLLESSGGCCDGRCRKRKRHRRLKRWLRAEMSESALWAHGKSSNQKYAELVLGTCGDVYWEREMQKSGDDDESARKQKNNELQEQREAIINEVKKFADDSGGNIQTPLAMSSFI